MRLIDADKLIAHLEDEIDECKIPFGSRANGKGIAYGTALGLKSAISFAKTAPTVDIKTEVARGIFEEIKQGLEKLSNAYREKGDYSGVVHIIQARSIVISRENKYTKEGVDK